MAGPLNYIDFLRDVGRHFSVNRMLSFDSVKLRLDREQPLSFLEFNYMILQAYDFLELSPALRLRAADGRLRPVGQHRQRHRPRAPHAQRSSCALTTPLLTTPRAPRWARPAQGAVWLNADMLSPYDYWQFWRNTEDADVGGS
jgi:tyrosyl-tRNA synthetase